MKDQPEAPIPAHLQELLQPTPSGTAKLIAAWDGLTPETQIALLVARKKRAGEFDYFYHRVLEKALTSDNAFVRYMAARETSFRDREERKKEGIDNDPEALVRYAHLETQWGSSELEDAEVFFALPHEARLAKVRLLRGWGEAIANLISYAIEHQLKDGTVSELELFEILSDYLNNPEFKNRYVKDRVSHDGSTEYFKGKDIEAMWDLVLNVPECLSHVIIENLPESAGLSSGIPRRVLDGMNDQQLQTLFYRDDIGLKDLRKRKFFEAAESDGEGKGNVKHNIQDAAVTHAFDLTNEEFGEILSKAVKLRVSILKSLSWAQDLRLCLYEAIRDDLRASDASLFGHDLEAEFARKTFERKLAQLPGRRREKELPELKLYRLAVRAVPWNKAEKGYPPSGELAFLKEEVVEGDTWATFVAFSKKWDEAPYRTIKLEKYLPKIWEAGEEERPALDDEDIKDSGRLADRVAHRLADLFATARDEPGGEESKLAQALGKLSVHATVAQERTLEAVNSLKAELAEWRRLHDRQRVFAWIVIALLAGLFFVGR